MVDINNLDSSNIAVQIKGDAKADAVDAVDYLQQTPLPKLIGLETFLTDVAKLKGLFRLSYPKYGCLCMGITSVRKPLKVRWRLRMSI